MVGIDEFESSSVGISLSKFKYFCFGVCDYFCDCWKVGYGDICWVSVDLCNIVMIIDCCDVIGGRRVMCYVSSCC